MISNKDIRKQALGVLKGNWLKAIGMILLTTGVGIALEFIDRDIKSIAINIILSVLQIIFSVVITTAALRFYLVLSRENNAGYLDTFKFSVNNIWTYFKLIFAIGLKVIAWSLLFIIPGIIASINYSQALFIKMDDPNIRTFEAIRKSTELMKGYKWKYFALGLSFIGWSLLSVLTIGIGMLWVSAYYNTSRTIFYNELRLRAEPPIDLTKE
jgi:uncharacterized membrane protein